MNSVRSKVELLEVWTIWLQRYLIIKWIISTICRCTLLTS